MNEFHTCRHCGTKFDADAGYDGCCSRQCRREWLDAAERQWREDEERIPPGPPEWRAPMPH